VRCYRLVAKIAGLDYIGWVFYICIIVFVVHVLCYKKSVQILILSYKRKSRTLSACCTLLHFPQISRFTGFYLLCLLYDHKFCECLHPPLFPGFIWCKKILWKLSAELISSKIYSLSRSHSFSLMINVHLHPKNFLTPILFRLSRSSFPCLVF